MLLWYTLVYQYQLTADKQTSKQTKNEQTKKQTNIQKQTPMKQMFVMVGVSERRKHLPLQGSYPLLQPAPPMLQTCHQLKYLKCKYIQLELTFLFWSLLLPFPT